jgi:hypothetical protein
MKKYYTNWKGIIVIGVIIFLLTVLGSIPKYSDVAVIKADLFFLIFWGFVLLISTKYSYVDITGSTLKFVYVLFIRRTIDINPITAINDQPTYKVVKGAFRSLYIFYKGKNDLTKWIELRITIFPEKTLGKLIRDLKQINPRIELNKLTFPILDFSKHSRTFPAGTP